MSDNSAAAGGSVGVEYSEGRAQRTASRAVRRPKSCTNMWINVVGLLSFFASLPVAANLDWASHHRVVLVVCAAMLPIIVLDLAITRVHRRESTGLVWNRAVDFDLARIAVKLWGLTATLAVLGFAYTIFPVYDNSLYEPFWEFVKSYGPWLLIGAVVYFVAIDGRMAEPRDGYWHAGRLAMGIVEDCDRHKLVEHAKAWTVKGFFLPLMFSYMAGNLIDFTADWSGDWWLSFGSIYDISWIVIFGIDLVFVTAGYILTLRVIDAHIRTSEPTVFGWLVAIICYQPFWGLLAAQYFFYNDDLYWGNWLWSNPIAQTLWGSAILVLLVVYALSAVVFGCRFSNLTHRGILTNGPFRFTKHPAYVTKNISWWLISVPFISAEGPIEAMTMCVLLFGVNAIYFARAKTEERHLSWDPDYVAYALWIEENGVFRWVGRLLPFVRYRPPAEPLVKPV